MDGQPLRILLVDDDEDTATLIRDLLATTEYAQFTLEQVTTMAAALETLSESHDACLVADRLGESNGLSLLDAALARGYKGPILLLAGQESRADSLEAIRRGAADWLVKRQIDAATLARALCLAIERKRREQTLLASGALYRRLVELAPEAIVVHSEGKVVYVNAAGAALIGAASPEALLGKPVLDFLHPDYHEVALARIQRTQRNGEDVDFLEEKFIRPDGQVIDVEVVGAPTIYQGKPATQLVVRDITGRKQTEAALREAELRYRTVADFTHDWEYWEGPDGELRYVSPACERITGYTVAQFVADPTLLHTIIIPEDRQIWTDHRAEIAAASAPREIQFRIRRKDGEVRWIEHICRPVVNGEGGFLGYRANNRDITQRKRTHQSLRQIREQLLATLDALPDIMFILDKAGRFHDFRASNADLLFAPPQAFLGQAVDEVLPPVAASTIMNAIDEAVAKGRHMGAVYSLETPTGLRWFELSIATMGDLNKPEGRLVVMARDITKRMQTEVERERLIQELDAFAHTVAHDLKNPLNLVTGFTSALLDDYASLPPEELTEYLGMIDEAGRRMNNIIDELLLLAQLRQLEELQIHPLDMSAIVASTRDRLAYMIASHQAEIAVPDEWPLALGYGPWVEEVWANYLSNGLKYGTPPPRLRLGATRLDDGTIRFWVRDNGPGLTSEERARLFTPFTRLEQVRAKGHGLGLSIVRRIVERLGGEVGVESVPGEGSIFSFTLPVANIAGDEGPAT